MSKCRLQYSMVDELPEFSVIAQARPCRKHVLRKWQGSMFKSADLMFKSLGSASQTWGIVQRV